MLLDQVGSWLSIIKREDNKERYVILKKGLLIKSKQYSALKKQVT